MNISLLEGRFSSFCFVSVCVSVMNHRVRAFPFFRVSRRLLCRRQLHSSSEFDVLVIGGGHAGSEAAAAAGRIGAKTGLITQVRGGGFAALHSFFYRKKNHLVVFSALRHYWCDELQSVDWWHWKRPSCARSGRAGRSDSFVLRQRFFRRVQ